MRTKLKPKTIKLIPKEVWDIFKKFTKAGFEIYLVGAGGRNLISAKKPVDCDFTTNARPNEIKKLFKKSFYDNVFGTVGIPIKRNKHTEIYEITTYRKEWGYSDRRRPDKVVWGDSLEEDLKRRDFTWNTIVVGPKKKLQTPNSELRTNLELIDLFGGIKDFKAKVVKAVGDPNDRFAEDALRMLRAIRFAAQLGFTIEEKTFQAIKNNTKLIQKISGERIRDELIKILKSDYPGDGFTLLLSSGLLEEILPELVKEYGVAQARHHKDDVWTHSLLSLKHCPSNDPIVRFATLLHDVGKPVTAKPGKDVEVTFYNHEVVGASIVRNIANRLKFSKKDRELLFRLVRWHQFSVDERQTDKAFRRFIRRVGKENLADMLDLRVGDRLGGGCRETSWRLEEFKKHLVEVQKQPFLVTDLKINGNDVMKEKKITPGPLVGKILNQLFDQVVDGKVKNERKALLTRLKKFHLKN